MRKYMSEEDEPLLHSPIYECGKLISDLYKP